MDGANGMDIVVANMGDGSVTIFYNQGNGVFTDMLAHRINFSLTGGPPANLQPRKIIVADLDQGAFGPDIVVACANAVMPSLADLQIALSDNMNGMSFAAPVPVNIGGDALSFSVAAEDMDGTTGVDLVVSEYQVDNIMFEHLPGTGGIRVFSNDGAGGFMVGASVFVNFDDPVLGTAQPRSVAVGNFNSSVDAHIDVVAGNGAGTTQSVGVFLGDGLGNVGVPGISSISTFSNIGALRVVDVNSDNLLDVVAADTAGDLIGIMVGDGAGVFSISTTAIAGGSAPVDVAVGDFNNDNISDVVTANGGVATTSVFIGGETSYFIGGEFTLADGSSINRIAKLDTDGKLNVTSFNPGAGANGTVRGIILDDLDRVIIVGDFTLVDAAPRKGIARLNTDGSVDLSFTPGTGSVQGNIHAVAIDPVTKKIVVGGDFTGFNGAPGARPMIARLNVDGSVDATFDTVPVFGVVSGVVKALAVRPGGRSDRRRFLHHTQRRSDRLSCAIDQRRCE